MQTTSQLVVHDPDGVPHRNVGFTLLLAVATAATCFAALISGTLAQALLLALLSPVLIALARASSRRA